MPRSDLLSLTLDDLSALTNRGTVKRAQRELESGEVRLQLQETADGAVEIKWSDGVTSSLAAGAVLANGKCSCPATELCRHLIRLALAYQRQHAGSTTAAVDGPWNPGAITDEELARAFKKPALDKARTRFAEGLLIELVRSGKPTARFHGLAHTVRFLVPGDARYTHCDCAEEAPCTHAAMAVWAFRELPAGQNAGFVSTRTQKLPVPAELLNAIEEALLELAERGLSGAGTAWRDGLLRLEQRGHETELIWLARALAEIAQQHERYASHDALFSATTVAELAGELLLRSDAIRNDTGAVPQPLIRGMRSDRESDLAQARYIGLGCDARPSRRAVALSAYLADADSGNVLAVSREFADPTDAAETPKDFWQLAKTAILRDASLADLGAGQLLTQGAKRTADNRLVVGRARAAVNPQSFAWENLRAPVFAEDFAELRLRLSLLPPSALRPRRVAEDFHVCPLAGVESARFNDVSQAVEAVLRDRRGDKAMLVHPFTTRGREGAEQLLAQLEQRGGDARFVAGHVRSSALGLLVDATALVFQSGASRVVAQPYTDRWSGGARKTGAAFQESCLATDSARHLVCEILEAAGEVLVGGIQRSDALTVKRWTRLREETDAAGFNRIAAAVGTFADELIRQSGSARHDHGPGAKRLLQITMLGRLALDL